MATQPPAPSVEPTAPVLSESEERKLVKDIEERFLFFDQSLTNVKQNMSRWHRLYLGERKDPRKETEKWRSNTWLGDPFHQTQTEVAVLLSILNGVDPSISAEGVGQEDEWKGRAFTRAMDYFLRMNKWSAGQESLLTKCSIQGWSVIEVRWREISYDVIMRPNKKTMIAYDEAVNSAMMQGMPEPPDAVEDQAGYQMWMEQARMGNPSMPSLAPTPQKIVAYRGPWFQRNSDFDYYFDANIEDWSQHELFIKRVIKPWSWIEANPEFDQEKVKRGKGKAPDDGQRVSKWEREINQRIGLTYNENDPLWRDAGEILEVWRIKDKKAPYLCILNRQEIIRSGAHPYWHRQLPFVPVRNIPIEGRAFGMSSYQQLEKAFYDRVKFRDLLMDNIVLSTLGVFLKGRTLGMPDSQKMISPGMIADVNDVNAWRKGWESVPGFPELVQVTQMILQDQNLMLSTGENVRGQAATVGRVSATEAQSRMTQALTRHSQRAIRIEEELNPMIPQALSLVAQKWPATDPALMELRARIVGEDEQDPWVPYDLTRDTFSEALNFDIKFRGASRTQDRQLQAQQLKDFIQFGASVQVAPGIPALTGTEVRNGLRKMIQTLGVKGASLLVSPEGDAIVMQGVQSAQLQVQSAIMQQQMQMQQMMQPQPQIDPTTGQPIQPQQAPPEQGQEVPVEQG